MRGHWMAALLVAALLGSSAVVRAEDREPTAVVALGGATEWSLDGGTSFGPTASVEFTPIKDWLEIEIGATSLFSRGHPEWSADFILKKPFVLSPTVELMVGAGPEWKVTTRSVAAEAVLDVMVWPSPERKFGWFVEPSFSYDLGSGHERSLAVSAGLLIAIE